MSEIKLPEIIGSYRITGRIGQGGMGVVFRAVHSTLERPVALKILPDEFANNPEYVSRFLREARVVATLHHPNVVQVYDAGAQDGKYFIAMELIDGMSLGKYLEEKKCIDEKESVELLEQAARGLAAAHEAGLVHRDIKPDNLLLDKHGKIHIVDFGLVMESTSNTQLTITGACLGTPQYMSPEMADGEKADARSDIYSLGITFYRAVTGRLPFDSPTVMNLLFKHKFEAAEDPRTINEKLSQNYCNLILTMMAKNREQRPQSAQDLLALIEKLKSGKRIPSPPVFETPYSSDSLAAGAIKGSSVTARNNAFRGLGSSQKKALFAGFGLALSVLGAVGLYSWFSSRPQKEAEVPGDSRERSEVSVDNKPAQSASIFKPSGASSGESQKSSVQIVDEPAEQRIGSTEQRAQLIAKAQELTQRNDHQGALQKYREAAAIDPDGLALPIGEVQDKWRSQLLDDTRRFEAIGDLDSAMRKANEAHALKDASADIERIRRRMRLKNTISEAEQALTSEDYLKASTLFAQAATLADEEQAKKQFTERSSLALRENFIQRGQAAAKREAWSEAAEAYGKAQELKADPAVADLAIKYRELARNQGMTEFDRTIAAGKQAQAAKRFAEAREHFVKAHALDPQSKLPGALLLELDGDVILDYGDRARNERDYKKARTQYQLLYTQKNYAKHKETARLRLEELDRLERGGSPVIVTNTGDASESAVVPPPVAVTETQVTPVVSAEERKHEVLLTQVNGLLELWRIDDARRLILDELRKSPADTQLHRYKNGIEALQACEIVYKDLDAIVASGVSQANTANKYDSLGIVGTDFLNRLESDKREIAQNRTLAASRFKHRQFDELPRDLGNAKSFSGRIAGRFESIKNEYKTKADKLDKEVVERNTGISVPILGKVGVGRDKEKAKRLNEIASAYEALELKARTLSQ